MNRAVPVPLIRAIGWAAATFIATAVIRWRLEDSYHTVLALVLAAPTLFIERTRQPNSTAAFLLFGALAFAVYRFLLGLALL